MGRSHSLLEPCILDPSRPFILGLESKAMCGHVLITVSPPHPYPAWHLLGPLLGTKGQVPSVLPFHADIAWGAPPNPSPVELAAPSPLEGKLCEGRDLFLKAWKLFLEDFCKFLESCKASPSLHMTL